jgi:trimeric autotransporter adhesin
MDMVVANIAGSVSVYLHSATPGTFNAAINYQTGGAPNQVVLADVNGDGKPDIVLADLSRSGNVILLEQDPSQPGQFLAPVMLPTGVSTASVAVQDLNGDGAADIVATGYDNNGNNGAVYVFYQVAAHPGTFATPVRFPAGAGPQSVKIADMNADLLPDLVVANFGPGADGTGIAGVSVRLQDPTHPGALLSATSYAGFGQPLGVAMDLNNDGLPDIAAADGSSATVMLQIKGKPGQFSPAVQVGP